MVLARSIIYLNPATGDGGKAISGATGGRGGDVGSGNKNFDTQRFDNANLSEFSSLSSNTNRLIPS
jgi:hypothetical protein